MKSGVCIGAVDLDGFRPIRMLLPNGQNPGVDHPAWPGEDWQVEYTPLTNKVPHTEDCAVHLLERISFGADLHSFISENLRICRGPLEDLFDRHLTVRWNSSAFLSDLYAVPAYSTQFWFLDRDIPLILYRKRNYYQYMNQGQSIRIPYVGLQGPARVLEAGSLLRMSLARWWRPLHIPGPPERFCHLQLSGYYPRSTREFLQSMGGGHA